jgi:PAS domain S-box-containing protein
MTEKQIHKELQRRIKELENERLDRIRAEEALKENERRCRAIFDQTYQFIGLMTPQGILIEANRTALEFSGVEASNVLGKPFWETPWWTHSTELQQQLRDAVKKAAGGQFVRFEATHPCADGTLRDVDFSVKPVKDETGRVVLLIPEGRDITDRKLWEEALRQSENTARALLDAPTDSAMLLDPEGKVLAINKIAAERLGKTVHEIVGKSIFDSMSGDVNESRRERFVEAIQSRLPLRFEDQTGGKFYDNNLYPILDAEGKVAQVAVYGRDITDYRLAVATLEQRTNDLAESEEKYRTLVENIPIVVYRMAPGGAILFVNQVVQDLFGYSPTEIIRNPGLWHERVYEADRPYVEELRASCFREGKEFVAEYRVKHKSGHIVYVTDHAIPVRLTNGPTRNVDGFIMDITGRIKLQEKLVRAEEIKTIGEVSARLAHEIRNPLVSVGGFARRILASMNPHDPNKSRVDIIIREVSRMEAILRMILSYIQPLELHLSLTDLNCLVEAVVESVSREVEQRKATMRLNLSPEPPLLAVDQVQMKHAVEILFKNALRQLPEGATLSVATCTKNGVFNLDIQYPVEAMSPDDVEHFFYPFKWTRAAQEIVDLPLSKILVDKHGGAINVILTEQNELTIHVALPL